MRTPGYWSEQMKSARSQEDVIQIVKEIQADVLRSCGRFAFEEREFALASNLSFAADALCPRPMCGGHP